MEHVGPSLSNLVVLRYFPDEALEWEFPNQQLGRFLVAPDFAKCNGPRAEAMGLLYASNA